MPMQTEPPYSHDQSPKTGLLLCNLGTPTAPTAAALRPYLAQFLSDPRVVELPRLLWWPILHGVVLRLRPRKSAAKYASIWLPDGSPLKVWTERQAKLLQGYLGERGHHVQVRWAMRYGQPSVASGLDALKAAGCTRILVLSAYPQYSAATTASVADAVFAWGRTVRNLPELRLVRNYHDQPEYIAALAASVRRHWQAHGRPNVLLLSFHGMPARTLEKGDPYHCECHKTARLLAEALGLSADQYRVTFQSRFGRAKWLQPYTEPTLIELARSGVDRVDAICPGFSCDCIETLEEINLEARSAFLQAGGKAFHYIPCLNDSHEGMQALTALCEQHLLGWPTRLPPDPSACAHSRQRALSMGAKS
ncbi:protoheme ferro-lyase [Serpentinimonas raichei]|uniref:Ferrochelatase n=1 Tax=Serpentinimonas raichei TaxID=1458425 RepID=A0A060NI43_9BURK|nr:ferrochelatase [Serpentinimonas raichei]BAO80907.1 protoheme ferro-lyase [Serpentinimonas raichei]